MACRARNLPLHKARLQGSHIFEHLKMEELLHKFRVNSVFYCTGQSVILSEPLYIRGKPPILFIQPEE